MLKIIFDEPKRLLNIKAHEGLDFETLTMEFFLNSIVIPAKKGRQMAIGELNGDVLAVIFKPLGTEALSMISMRYASLKERKLL
jgi:uncharacterized DUF497 family protein